MPAIDQSVSKFNQYHLARWYSTYRLVVAVCLLLVGFISNILLNQGAFLEFSFLVLVGYTVFCLAQFAAIYFTNFNLTQQLLFIFCIDVVTFSFLTLLSDGPNLHLTLLFVISIFSASVLLNATKALGITLIAVICIVYQLLLSNLFDLKTLSNITDSLLLAFLFFMVFAASQVAVQRFRILENITLYQSNEISRLQNINRSILEQIDIGYLVLDENYHVVLSNPAACTLLGIPSLYTHKKYPLYKVHTDLFEMIKFEELNNGEKFNFCSQQSQFEIHIEVQKLVVSHQVLTLLILQDSKKINHQVQQLKLASLGQLTASIAHEIRNPLAAIVQANELLNSTVENTQKVFLSQLISKQTGRIDKIIQDTLNMVRSQKTAMTQIELPTFIEHLLAEDIADIREKINIEQLEAVHIQFDENQLRQVLINLIRNAIRHNPYDHPYISLSIYPNQDHIHIDVRDYGKGVAQNHQNQLFNPFFSTEISGTGLGLYLSHTFCEANQAKLLYIDEQPGACFRIECSRFS